MIPPRRTAFGGCVIAMMLLLSACQLGGRCHQRQPVSLHAVARVLCALGARRPRRPAVFS